jgi:glycerol-3-phosphate cytidylyltransferase
MLNKIYKLRAEGKKIGFTCSTFDLLHAGHVAMLAEAKSKCDFLIVGILSDPTISRKKKNKPIQSLFERFLQLQAIECVDYIIPFESEEDLVDMLLVLLPDIRIIGEEYKDKEHTGKNIEGIENYYNSRRHHFSSTDLRERLRKLFEDEKI